MKLDWQHWLMLFGVPFLAGAAGYLEAPHPSEAWRFMLLHAVGAGIATALAVFKRSPRDNANLAAIDKWIQRYPADKGEVKQP